MDDLDEDQIQQILKNDGLYNVVNDEDQEEIPLFEGVETIIHYHQICLVCSMGELQYFVEV